MGKKGFVGKFLNLDIKTVIIIGLGVVLLLRNCTGSDSNKDIEIVKVDGKDYELLERKIDTVVVEKEVIVEKYVPKYITKVETVEVQIPVDVDSLAIVRKYFETYVVKDTLNLTYDFPKEVTDGEGNKPDSTLGFGILTDKITQNQIVERDVKWNFRIPTVYNTTIVKDPPKNQLYYGFNLGVNKTDVFSSASGGLILKTKQDKLYQLNLGVQNAEGTGLTPYVSGGLFWKINLKKD
jgi:hypothetical protein